MINLKELMIDDYVDVSGHGNPLKLGIIQEVSDVGNETTIGLKDCSGIFAGNEISPIELSKEFFLENCFRCQVNRIEMNYVHEFQHLLRLIGLSDYANNLKI